MSIQIKSVNFLTEILQPFQSVRSSQLESVGYLKQDQFLITGPRNTKIFKIHIRKYYISSTNVKLEY